jgi:hypothetical protein
LIIDALYLKVHHNRAVIDTAILLAYGVNNKEYREILGASTTLFSRLRCTCGGIFFISTGSRHERLTLDHFGLKNGRMAVFPSVP